MTFRLARIAAVAACACGAGVSAPTHFDDPPASAPGTPLAVVDVSVITMLSPQVLTHQTVLVRDGKIESIGPVATTAPPAGAVVIAGAGRFLMPALIDMHVHSRAPELTAYLDNGIATVRNMWGYPAVAQWTAEIAAGSRDGPTIISASPGLDGPPPSWPFTVLVTQPESARAAVKVQHDAGWRWLKVYSRLSPEVFDSIIVAARDFGIVPIGHVPLAVDIHHALAAGMHSIEHFTGYDRAVSRSENGGTWAWIDADPARYAELVQATLAAGTWNCPTMAIYSELARRQNSADRATIVQNRRRFLKALFDAGAPLLVGTDAGIDVVPAGTAIHDELDEFVASGLTPYQTLHLATIDAAHFLDRTDLGVVAPGAEASLILVSANPLENLTRLRSLSGMVLRGAWRPAK